MCGGAAAKDQGEGKGLFVNELVVRTAVAGAVLFVKCQEVLDVWCARHARRERGDESVRQNTRGTRPIVIVKLRQLFQFPRFLLVLRVGV